MCWCLDEEKSYQSWSWWYTGMLYFIHTDGFAVEFDHVHDFDRIICIFFGEKLHKTVALMIDRHTIFRLMNIDWNEGRWRMAHATDTLTHWTCLDKQFPQNGFIDTLVETTNIDGCVLISLTDRYRWHGRNIHRQTTNIWKRTKDLVLCSTSTDTDTNMSSFSYYITLHWIWGNPLFVDW